MIKKNTFSMIELLVGMAVLAIMMTFLIQAFVSAENLASSGTKSMDTFEKSNMTLDFMASDLRQLTVNKAPRTPIYFTYTNATAGNSTTLNFTGRQVFTATPGLRQAVQYNFDKATGVLSRKLDGTASTETLIDGISYFSLEFYDENNVKLHALDPSYASDTYQFKFLPNYCEITLKLVNDDAAGNQDTTRAFTRRIYFE